MKSQRMLRRASGIAVFGVAVMALIVPGAQAAAVTCGQVITASTVVTNDLTNCPADGLVIGANGIVLNLNGHRIGGTHNGDGIVIGSHDHVTVKNGQVFAFNNGIYVNGPDDAVSNVTSKSNGNDGVRVDAADRFRMTSSWMTGNDSYGVESSSSSNGTFNGVIANGNGADGFDIFGGSGTVGTTITQSTANSNYNSGINLSGVRFVTFTKNTLSGNQGGFSAAFTNGTGSVIDGNKATANASDGFQLAFTGGFALTNNRASSNGTGFLSELSGANTFDGNLATGNGYGFYVWNTQDNILRNNVAGATKGTSGAGGGNNVGMYIADSSNTVISDNAAHGNQAGDGIQVHSSSSGTTIRRNKTNYNHGDGINDNDGSSTVVQNAADFNSNFGIEAPFGTDGGGNEAHGNGGGQCSAGYSC